MALENITLGTAILGAVTGLTGAVLGVLNTWRSIRRDKVKLSVRSTWVVTAIPPRDVETAFQIEVVNLSEFPIYIVDVGFNLTGGRTATLATVPGVEPRGSLPLRLEPRTTYSKIFNIDALSRIAPDLKSAYARTECGEIATGTNPILKQLRSRACVG